MNQKQKTEMYDQISAHGENLLAIFPDCIEPDPVKLCKRLRRAEGEASRICTDLCNGLNTELNADEALDAILARVNRILGNKSGSVPVFINRDPRGCALKIASDFTFAYFQRSGRRLYSDWGGYGILAPDFTPPEE